MWSAFHLIRIVAIGALIPAVVILGSVRPAAAQNVGGCRTSRQEVLEQVEKDHFKLTGQVEIDCGDDSLSADQVEIFTETNTMIATGSVVFTSTENRIAADRLE